MHTAILSINPGSTSTKVAFYRDLQEVFCETLRHSGEELSRFGGIWEQLDFRSGLVLECMEKHGVRAEELSAVVGRGGLLPPVHAGAYRVNEAMMKRLMAPGTIAHASNLGAGIARCIASTAGVNAYIYDSVAVDELSAVARFTGFPELRRVCLSHALNSRAIARRCAEDMGVKYEDATLIVAHLGGSISIALHRGGRMEDFLDNDEGPFGPEACGKISAKALLGLIDKTDMAHVKKRVRGTGGVMGHLGTADMRLAEERALNGDEKARDVLLAMAYQIAKGIGELAPVVCGNVDQIALTGGIAYSEMITAEVARRVSFLAPVRVYPGEDEMKALCLGIRRVLLGEETAREYAE